MTSIAIAFPILRERSALLFLEATVGNPVSSLETKVQDLSFSTTNSYLMAIRITRDTFIGRDVGIVFGVLAALVILMYATRLQGLQIPGYLVLIGYDYLQNTLVPEISSVAFWVGFLVYLYIGSLLIGNLYHGLRHVTKQQ